MTRPTQQRRFVKVDDLKPAPYNPAGRVEKKALRDLLDSLELLGQLSPVVISRDNGVIDGHRRVAAAKILGWETVECLVTEKSATEVYASINGGTSRKLSGHDALSVWLREPLAVKAALSRRFRLMTEHVGTELVAKLHQAGHSYRVYQIACRLARYCDAPDSTKQMMEWLLACPPIGQVYKALEAGVPAQDILRAAKAKRPLRIRGEVA